VSGRTFTNFIWLDGQDVACFFYIYGFAID